MYFATSNTGNQQAAAAVARTAKAFGAALTAPERAHVPFESVVAAISHAKEVPTEQVASELFRLDPERRRKSLSVGLAEIVKGFGSERQTMEFFRRVTAPKATLRFEGVGGISEDLLQVKNRLASMVCDAYLQRQESELAELLPAEREYVDMLKSVRRELQTAVERSTLSPDVAEEVASDIEAAVSRVPLAGMSEYLEPMHSMARSELYAETMDRVRKRYAVKPTVDGPEVG